MKVVQALLYVLYVYFNRINCIQSIIYMNIMDLDKYKLNCH